MTYCAACYCRNFYCRRCKTHHCQCTYNECQRQPRKIVHASKVFQRHGGTVTTTLCGRMRLGDDGINVADEGESVSCKFCLKRLATEVE